MVKCLPVFGTSFLGTSLDRVFIMKCIWIQYIDLNGWLNDWLIADWFIDLEDKKNENKRMTRLGAKFETEENIALKLFSRRA